MVTVVPPAAEETRIRPASTTRSSRWLVPNTWRVSMPSEVWMVMAALPAPRSSTRTVSLPPAGRSSVRPDQPCAVRRVAPIATKPSASPIRKVSAPSEPDSLAFSKMPPRSSTVAPAAKSTPVEVRVPITSRLLYSPTADQTVSIRVSMPAASRKMSWPRPPVTSSSPAPESRTSANGEPTRVSLPSPPIRVSATESRVIAEASSLSFPPAASMARVSPSARTAPTSHRVKASVLRTRSSRP